MQYLRKLSLIVSGASQSLDLSQLDSKFSIKKTDAKKPNEAKIVIYNMNPDTINSIKKEFNLITIEAGYEDNHGVIFMGNITDYKYKKEGTDSEFTITAGDGDRAYNFSTISKTLSAGSTANDQIKALAQTMSDKGVSQGYIETNSETKLPRGKVMFGMSRQYLQQVSDSAVASFSIQDGKIQVLPMAGALPNEAIKISSSSGMIGSPEQQDGGMTVKCLINPSLRVGNQIYIEDSDNLNDGYYQIIKLEYDGEIRGNDWTCTITCIEKQKKDTKKEIKT